MKFSPWNRPRWRRKALSEPGYLFDTNVWIALVFQSHPLHAAASSALIVASPQRKVHFCRSTQQSFLRLTSSEKMARHYGVPPFSNSDAIAFLKSFIWHTNVVLLVYTYK